MCVVEYLLKDCKKDIYIFGLVYHVRYRWCLIPECEGRDSHYRVRYRWCLIPECEGRYSMIISDADGVSSLNMKVETMMIMSDNSKCEGRDSHDHVRCRWCLIPECEGRDSHDHVRYRWCLISECEGKVRYG